VLADVIDALRCPHCTAPLVLDSGTTRCRNRHSFDVARQGYLNLVSTAVTGDTAGMVAARADFLATGNYSPIRDAVASASYGENDRHGLVVEIGAGTAYYLAALMTGDRRGVALDVSRYAARRAAKAHPRIGSVMADVWRSIPLRDGCASVVLDVFAPRNAAEIARILAPDGVFLLVTPNRSHLRELVDGLGLIRVDEAKEQRIAGSLGAVLDRTSSLTVEYPITLDRSTARLLVAMGPNAWHTDTPTLPESLTTTVSVTLSRWRRRTTSA
jgi:23S rRNA (guanine745-N1)-methyltransferase